jgi:cytochrome P450
VENVSINLTTQMLATLFDFPFEERSKLTYWSDIAAGTPELTGATVPPEERVAGLTECLETFTRIWHERKDKEGGFDLISLLQRDPHTADMVDKPMEFLGNLCLLIVGGNDTTRNSATGGVVALNRYPGEYDKLRADHGLIPNMVSEIIRWQTPLAHMRRTATRDLEFQGQQIRKGDKVVMWYISGNRDDSVIEKAEDFIIDRPNARKHVSFGFGIHRCMGNRLGEMQLRILWEEIMQRFSFVEVMEEPDRVESNFVHGYTKLPVRLHAQ